mgnify:FL=1
MLRVTRQLIDQRGSDLENKEDLDKTPLDSEQVQGPEESTKGGNRCEMVSQAKTRKKVDKHGNKHVDVSLSSGSKKAHL